MKSRRGRKYRSSGNVDEVFTEDDVRVRGYICPVCQGSDKDNPTSSHLCAVYYKVANGKFVLAGDMLSTAGFGYCRQCESVHYLGDVKTMVEYLARVKKFCEQNEIPLSVLGGIVD